MKKHSRLAFGAFWAGVMIFVAVQVVSAEVVSGPHDIVGTITSMTGDGLVFDEAIVDEVILENVHVYGMGPASYWAMKEVAFPRVGDEVRIVAYIMVADGQYVAAAFIDNDETEESTITIELREEVYDRDDDTHLIPLWSNSKKLLPETVTTVISATPVDCTCDCKSFCQKDACDCTCDCEDCLENQNQNQKGKRRAQ